MILYVNSHSKFTTIFFYSCAQRMPLTSLWRHKWRPCIHTCGWVMSYITYIYPTYHRSGNFHVKHNLREKFVFLNFHCFIWSTKFFWWLTIAIWMSAWGVPTGLLPATRRAKKQDIYPVECGLAHKLIHWSLLRNFIFRVLNFRGWSRPQNYFNSKIFPIYGSIVLSLQQVGLLGKLLWISRFCGCSLREIWGHGILWHGKSEQSTKIVVFTNPRNFSPSKGFHYIQLVILQWLLPVVLSPLQNEYLHQPLELVRVVQTCLYREAELVERQEQLNVCVMNSQWITSPQI